MLITNGTKIVTIPQDAEELQNIRKTLKSRAKDVLGIKADFKINEQPFMHMESEVEFDDLKKICFPDIDVQFRAIGNESVQMPTSVIRDIKHTYTAEEKQVIADNFVNIQYEKEALEREAKESAKGYKAQIDKMEGQISDLAAKHRQGYETQSQECNLHLNFETGMRVYTGLSSNEILATEPMEPKDYQMKIEFKDGEPNMAVIDAEDDQEGGF